MSEFMHRDNNITNPSHYRQGGREAIDVIREELGLEAFLGFCMGNAMKYCIRAAHKGCEIDDMDKASWYLQMHEHHDGGCVVDPRESRDPSSTIRATILRESLLGSQGRAPSS